MHLSPTATPALPGTVGTSETPAPEATTEQGGATAAPPAPAVAMVVPVDGATVLSGGAFGERPNIGGVNLLPNGNEMHHGIDYAAPIGTPIKAAAGGTVILAEWNPHGGGHETVIDHGLDDTGRPVFTRYLHQSAIGVPVGATVRQGDVIGAVGRSGNVTGPHLHFEVSHAFTKHGWSVETVDPQVYLSGQRSFPSSPAPAPAPAPAPDPPSPLQERAPADGLHTVQPGDTLGAIALRHGTTVETLQALNADTIHDPNVIHVGAAIRLAGSPNPAPTARTYEVRPGDTLGEIALSAGVTLHDLIAANHAAVGANPDLIHVGMVLQLP